MSPNCHNPVGNRLLAALPREEYERLLPHLESIDLPYKQSLYNPNEPLQHVYFPNEGVISVLVLFADGGIIEVTTVGNEGMIGIPILLGSDRATAETFVQVPGDALRMKVDVFKREVYPGTSLHTLLLRYIEWLISQLMQSAACNQMHSIEQRACRWLLMTHDRVHAEQFPLTQEFLAQMLGVRRASVSEVAAALQKAGLIRYHRGLMTILDRQGLETDACECYQVIRNEYARLLG